MSSQSISFRPARVIEQLPWGLDQKAALGFLLILVTFSLVGWLYLGQASLITSSTMKIDELRQEIETLNQRNSELALEIAELESISRVEARARDLGFAPTRPADIRYLSIPNYPFGYAQDRPASAPEMLVAARSGAAQNDAPWQKWLDGLAAQIAGNSSNGE